MVGNRLLVRPVSADRHTPGGILLAETAEQRIRWGEVLAVGPGLFLLDGKRPSPEVGVGDHVCFREISAVDMRTQEGDLLRVVTFDDVLAIQEAK